VTICASARSFVNGDLVCKGLVCAASRAAGVCKKALATEYGIGRRSIYRLMAFEGKTRHVGFD
jgi:hypothetical protein